MGAGFSDKSGDDLGARILRNAVFGKQEDGGWLTMDPQR
jgi:hypothetical protein